MDCKAEALPGGRYAALRARINESGVVALPPPVPDPLPGRLAMAAAVSLALLFVLRSSVGDSHFEGTAFSLLPSFIRYKDIYFQAEIMS